MTTLQTPPISVRIDPIFGLFMCGSDINDDYNLNTKSLYKLTTQLRIPKQSRSSEIYLMEVRSDPPKLKFHGKLETPADCVTKYDKEEFLQDTQ